MQKYKVRICRNLVIIIQKRWLKYLVGESGIWRLIWIPDFPYGNECGWIRYRKIRIWIDVSLFMKIFFPARSYFEIKKIVFIWCQGINRFNFPSSIAYFFFVISFFFNKIWYSTVTTNGIQCFSVNFPVNFPFL